MTEWFIKKITGDDLMDKALDLAIAEENAHMIINALRPELEEISDDRDPIVIRTEGGGTGGGMTFWQSKRFEEENITVTGSRSVFKVKGVGKLVDAYVNHASSNSFSAELMVDGHKWYADTYTNLSQKSIADSHLAVYQDADTSEYIIKFSGINFVQDLELIVGASGLTFDVLRVNYEMLV
jgi:hypothetical protein